MNSLELLRAYSATLKALRERGLIRSKNVVGDYAERLFATAYNWTLQPPSNRDFDAVHEGVRYQVKARHITRKNPSRQLGDLPEDGEINFDVLAVALLDDDFTLLRAALMPVQIMLPLRTRVSNRPRLIMRDSVWEIDGVRDVTEDLKSAQAIL